MKKIYLIVSYIFLKTIIFCQNSPNVIRSKSVINNDTAIVLTAHVKYNGQTIRDVEKGVYKILKIDDFFDFYLIFIEKDGISSTIFSAKTVIKDPSVTKELNHADVCMLKIDSTYNFELTCKDTLSNGMCSPIVSNVTYFGKYTGFDLKKIQKAKNLYGLFLVNTK